MNTYANRPFEYTDLICLTSVCHGYDERLPESGRSGGRYWDESIRFETRWQPVWRPVRENF